MNMAKRVNTPVHPAGMEEILAARDLLEDMLYPSPLIRLNTGENGGEIYLKLENLQPVGSFKIRPVANIIRNQDAKSLKRGVYTASSGNTGIAVAWAGAKLGIRTDVVVPDNAPRGKLDVLARLGATVHKIPFSEWWNVIISHRFPGLEGTFIDAVGDRHAIAGDGTIGLEIVRQLPDVDTVLIPFGGGGLTTGIASSIRALKPDVRIVACESEAAIPLTAAFRNGGPVEVDHRDCFISGIGVGSLLPWMWPAVAKLVDGTAVVTLQQVAGAIRMLAERNRVIAEGAGAVSVAAALSGVASGGKMVCVVSGGNIDRKDFITILQGGIPA